MTGPNNCMLGLVQSLCHFLKKKKKIHEKLRQKGNNHRISTAGEGIYPTTSFGLPVGKWCSQHLDQVSTPLQ